MVRAPILANPIIEKFEWQVIHPPPEHEDDHTRDRFFDLVVDLNEVLCGMFAHGEEESAVINWGTNQLGTSDGVTFTPIGTATRPKGHTWSGLAIDPVSGEAYLSSTNSEESLLAGSSSASSMMMRLVVV